MVDQASVPLFKVRIVQGEQSITAWCSSVPRKGEVVKLQNADKGRNVLAVLHQFFHNDPKEPETAFQQITVVLGEEVQQAS
jgi:hypothetical protein